MFFVHFELPNKFVNLKNRKLFLETKNKKEKTVTKHTLSVLVRVRNVFLPYYYLILGSLLNSSIEYRYKNFCFSICKKKKEKKKKKSFLF